MAAGTMPLRSCHVGGDVRPKPAIDAVGTVDNSSAVPDAIQPSEKLRDILRGFPEATVLACAEFQQTRDPAAFDRALTGIIQHHLINKPDVVVASLPGSTRLVADLALDSLTMVEMAFLFEDLFGTTIPQDDFVKIVTLDDLKTLLLARIQSGAAQ